MPLMDLWRSSPESISAYMIRQIVAISGDGRLRDESDCAAELRAYLAQVSAEKLSAYSNECLNDGFEDSGYVLQDVVNEVGRRLGFQVENGRYQGRQGGIGYDGIWRAEPDIALIAEVKTTDTYNVRLDAVADYREKLRAAGLVAPSASTLFVVGRKDTGALEAQIRGSRYAWDMRVVGVESLVKLMQIVVKSNERSTLRQIRELLRPFEYTRVDRIVDVVFGAATDVELAREEEVAPEADSVVLTDASNRIPAGDLENMRRRIITAVSSSLGIPLVQHRRVFFESSDGETRACIAISKRYERAYQPYWYAFHQTSSDYLHDATKGVFVLGCMDREEAFALPVSLMDTFLPKLNQTIRQDGQSYWHIVLTTLEDGALALYSSRTSETLPLSPYSIRLAPK
jgi:hypothetical protein